ELLLLLKIIGRANCCRGCLWGVMTEFYGSFFGPSQLVVARRVIDETRARLEAVQVVARIAKEFPEKSYATASYTRHKDKEPRPPKVAINETKKKAQHLKAARDYSFLFSEDGEILGTETNIDKSFRP
ncbi:hypothetical protein KI387_034248, partial [Taxus chinensis]